jgi:hypothetical protein
VTLFADDDVVVHGDAERARHGNDLVCHLDIGLRRCGVAGGVVVDEDDGGCREFERAFDYLPRINRGVVDGADLLMRRLRLSRKMTRNCSRSAKACAVRQ